MSKEIQFYKGELSASGDKYHYTQNNQLYILFDTNESTILPGHEKVIREKVVDFMVRAVRALGPDPDYKLKVLGMTSATGDQEYNSTLAGKRAYNAAMCAIKNFEKLQPGDPTLAGTSITPVVEVLADRYSAFDNRLMRYGSRARIEKNQGFFRSAVFAFKGANDVEPFASPNIVAVGPEAVRRALEILERNKNAPNDLPYPTPWGVVILRRGQVWDPHHRLIVAADWWRVTYLSGETLWSVPTPDFAREVLIDGIVEGMVRSKPLVEATEVVMSFVQGVMVGPLVATAAKLIVLFMWAGAHEPMLRKAMNALDPAIDGLKLINQRYPTLWKKLLEKMKEEASKEFVDALIETVTSPKNIAFFLGRIIRGLIGDVFFGGGGGGSASFKEGWEEKVLKTGRVTFGKVAFIVVEVAVLVTALHLPEAFASIAAERVKELAEGLQESFKKGTIAIGLSPWEAEQIAKELLNYSDTKQKLKDLEKPMKDIEKALVQFQKDFDLKQ